MILPIRALNESSGGSFHYSLTVPKQTHGVHCFVVAYLGEPIYATTNRLPCKMRLDVFLLEV